MPATSVSRTDELEKLAVLRREIAAGLKQADAGEFSFRSIADIARAAKVDNSFK
ncbi:hypothetical protein [Inquilinus sp. CAU 1745]|uniref:hypothetical protein n=1 Tax=Inquilinus sp. CAU 1745 TaxID=3140369 RepID=UPI00325A63E1